MKSQAMVNKQNKRSLSLRDLQSGREYEWKNMKVNSEVIKSEG